jgi:hypothetical protein
MGPSIEGLGCTVTPFQLILKYFKRRHHFVDPGILLRASMPAVRWEQEEFDRTHFLTLRDLIWSNHESFRHITLSILTLLALEFPRWEGILACEWKCLWMFNCEHELHLAQTITSCLNNCLSKYELIVQGSLLSCAALRLQSWLEVNRQSPLHD